MYKLTFILFIIIIMNMISLYNDRHYHEYYSKNKKIYDVGYKYLPNINQHEYLINYISYVIIILLIFTNFVVDFLKLFFIIYIIRFIFTQITVLPKIKHCNIQQFNPFGYCYDKIFSGHISFLFLFTLFLYETNYISIYILGILNIINMCLIISTRAHYTIEVIVAFIITFFIFKNKKIFLSYMK